MEEENYIEKFKSSDNEPWCRTINEGTIFYKGGLLKKNTENLQYTKPSWYSTKTIAEVYTNNENDKNDRITAKYKTTKSILLLDIRSESFHTLLNKIITKIIRNDSYEKNRSLLENYLWRSSIQFNMNFVEQFQYLIEKRSVDNPLFMTYYKKLEKICAQKQQPFRLLQSRIDNYKIPEKRKFVCDDCDQYIEPGTTTEFLPQRYSTSEGDKQLVKVLNYLFGYKYQGYIAGK